MPAALALPMVAAFGLLHGHAHGTEAVGGAFGYELGIPGVNTKLFPDGKLYKLIITTVGVSFWLSWLSTILALLSTASMFPDLATGGVDTMLSKPIGGARLIVTKFGTGLLFTALQVSVFAVLAFLGRIPLPLRLAVGLTDLIASAVLFVVVRQKFGPPPPAA